MATVGMDRKLAAILAADVQGYSRFMGEDEVATLRTLTTYRKIIDTLIEQHRGRIVGTAGDSVLAEFASVVAVFFSLPPLRGKGPVSVAPNLGVFFI